MARDRPITLEMLTHLLERVRVAPQPPWTRSEDDQLLRPNNRFTQPEGERDMALTADQQRRLSNRMLRLERDHLQRAQEQRVAREQMREIRIPVPTLPTMWYQGQNGLGQIGGENQAPTPPTYYTHTWDVETMVPPMPTPGDPGIIWDGPVGDEDSPTTQTKSPWQEYWDHAPKHRCMACAEEVIVYRNGQVNDFHCNGCGVSQVIHVIDPDELSEAEINLITPKPKSKAQRHMDAYGGNIQATTGGTING